MILLKLLTIPIINCVILSRRTWASPPSCSENEIECGGKCCPLLPDAHCDPTACGENMECDVLNRCACKKGFHPYMVGEEYVMRCAFPLPQTCDTHENCGPSADCLPTKKCQCKNEYEEMSLTEINLKYCIKSDDAQPLQPSLPICPVGYSKCLDQCCGAQTRCQSGECVCEQGNEKIMTFLDHRNVVDCKALAKDRGEVSESQQHTFKCGPGYIECSGNCCGANTECHEGLCNCLDGYRIPAKYENSNAFECVASEKVAKIQRLLNTTGFDVDVVAEPGNYPKETEQHFVEILGSDVRHVTNLENLENSYHQHIDKNKPAKVTKGNPEEIEKATNPRKHNDLQINGDTELQSKDDQKQLNENEKHNTQLQNKEQTNTNHLMEGQTLLESTTTSKEKMPYDGHNSFLPNELEEVQQERDTPEFGTEESPDDNEHVEGTTLKGPKLNITTSEEKTNDNHNSSKLKKFKEINQKRDNTQEVSAEDSPNDKEHFDITTIREQNLPGSTTTSKEETTDDSHRSPKLSELKELYQGRDNTPTSSGEKSPDDEKRIDNTPAKEQNLPGSITTSENDSHNSSKLNELEEVPKERDNTHSASGMKSLDNEERIDSTPMKEQNLPGSITTSEEEMPYDIHNSPKLNQIEEVHKEKDNIHTASGEKSPDDKERMDSTPVEEQHLPGSITTPLKEFEEVRQEDEKVRQGKGDAQSSVFKEQKLPESFTTSEEETSNDSYNSPKLNQHKGIHQERDNTQRSTVEIITDDIEYFDNTSQQLANLQESEHRFSEYEAKAASNEGTSDNIRNSSKLNEDKGLHDEYVQTQKIPSETTNLIKQHNLLNTTENLHQVPNESKTEHETITATEQSNIDLSKIGQKLLPNITTTKYDLHKSGENLNEGPNENETGSEKLTATEQPKVDLPKVGEKSLDNITTTNHEGDEKEDDGKHDFPKLNEEFRKPQDSLLNEDSPQTKEQTEEETHNPQQFPSEYHTTLKVDKANKQIVGVNPGSHLVEYTGNEGIQDKEFDDRNEQYNRINNENNNSEKEVTETEEEQASSSKIFTTTNHYVEGSYGEDQLLKGSTKDQSKLTEAEDKKVHQPMPPKTTLEESKLEESSKEDETIKYDSEEGKLLQPQIVTEHGDLELDDEEQLQNAMINQYQNIDDKHENSHQGQESTNKPEADEDTKKILENRNPEDRGHGDLQDVVIDEEKSQIEQIDISIERIEKTPLGEQEHKTVLDITGESQLFADPGQAEKQGNVIGEDDNQFRHKHQPWEESTTEQSELKEPEDQQVYQLSQQHAKQSTEYDSGEDIFNSKQSAEEIDEKTDRNQEVFNEPRVGEDTKRALERRKPEDPEDRQLLEESTTEKSVLKEPKDGQVYEPVQKEASSTKNHPTKYDSGEETFDPKQSVEEISGLETNKGGKKLSADIFLQHYIQNQNHKAKADFVQEKRRVETNLSQDGSNIPQIDEDTENPLKINEEQQRNQFAQEKLEEPEEEHVNHTAIQKLNIAQSGLEDQTTTTTEKSSADEMLILSSSADNFMQNQKHKAIAGLNHEQYSERINPSQENSKKQEVDDDIEKLLEHQPDNTVEQEKLEEPVNQQVYHSAKQDVSLNQSSRGNQTTENSSEERILVQNHSVEEIDGLELGKAEEELSVELIHDQKSEGKHRNELFQNQERKANANFRQVGRDEDINRSQEDSHDMEVNEVTEKPLEVTEEINITKDLNHEDQPSSQHGEEGNPSQEDLKGHEIDGDIGNILEVAGEKQNLEQKKIKEPVDEQIYQLTKQEIDLDKSRTKNQTTENSSREEMPDLKENVEIIGGVELGTGQQELKAKINHDQDYSREDECEQTNQDSNDSEVQVDNGKILITTEEKLNVEDSNHEDQQNNKVEQENNLVEQISNANSHAEEFRTEEDVYPELDGEQKKIPIVTEDIQQAKDFKRKEIHLDLAQPKTHLKGGEKNNNISHAVGDQDHVENVSRNEEQQHSVNDSTKQIAQTSELSNYVEETSSTESDNDNEEGKPIENTNQQSLQPEDYETEINSRQENDSNETPVSSVTVTRIQKSKPEEEQEYKFIQDITATKEKNAPKSSQASTDDYLIGQTIDDILKGLYVTEPNENISESPESDHQIWNLSQFVGKNNKVDNQSQGDQNDRKIIEQNNQIHQIDEEKNHDWRKHLEVKPEIEDHNKEDQDEHLIRKEIEGIDEEKHYVEEEILPQHKIHEENNNIQDGTEENIQLEEDSRDVKYDNKVTKQNNPFNGLDGESKKDHEGNLREHKIDNQNNDTLVGVEGHHQVDSEQKQNLSLQGNTNGNQQGNATLKENTRKESNTVQDFSNDEYIKNMSPLSTSTEETNAKEKAHLIHNFVFHKVNNDETTSHPFIDQESNLDKISKTINETKPIGPTDQEKLEEKAKKVLQKEYHEPKRDEESNQEENAIEDSNERQPHINQESSSTRPDIKQEERSKMGSERATPMKHDPKLSEKEHQSKNFNESEVKGHQTTEKDQNIDKNVQEAILNQTAKQNKSLEHQPDKLKHNSEESNDVEMEHTKPKLEKSKNSEEKENYFSEIVIIETQTSEVYLETTEVPPLIDLFTFDNKLKPKATDPPTEVPKDTSDASIISLYSLENFCQDKRYKCHKLCCGPNGHCSGHENRECICLPDYTESYSKVLKAKICTSKPLKTRVAKGYVAVGVACLVAAIVATYVKCVRVYCKN